MALAPNTDATIKPIKPSVTSHTVDPPDPRLAGFGVHLSVPQLNEKVQQIADAHKQTAGFTPSPGLVFDVLRADPHLTAAGTTYSDLFSVPTSKRQAQAMAVARASVPGTGIGNLPVAPKPVVEQAFDMLHDPDKFASWAIKNGKKLQKELDKDPVLNQQFQDAFNQSQKNKSIYNQDAAAEALRQKQYIKEASIVPNVDKVGKGLSWLLLGATRAATGLVIGPAALAYYELHPLGKALKANMQGRPAPFGEIAAEYKRNNVEIAKGVAVGTYHDIHAIVTGDTKYLAEHPEAVFNTALMFTGAAGAAERLAKTVRAPAGERLSTFVRNPPPEGKTMTLAGDKGEATPERMQHENPIVRAADNLLTDRKKARSDNAQEVMGAGALRAVGLERAANALNDTFSYEAKFRRERTATSRVQTAQAVYLSRQLDNIAGPAIDAADVFSRMPKRNRNILSVGELKAMHVLTQGGNWREALQTMMEAHDSWRNAAQLAGMDQVAEAHAGQIAALKLAGEVLAKHEDGEISDVFKQSWPLFSAALDETTRLKIEHFGLSPETSVARDALEYDVYKHQEPIPNRKKIAALVENTQRNVDRLTAHGQNLADALVAADKRVRTLIEKGADEEEIAAARFALEDAKANFSEKGGTYRTRESGIKITRTPKHPQLDAAQSRLASLQNTLAEAEARVKNAEKRPGAKRVPLNSKSNSPARSQLSGAGEDFFARRGNAFGDSVPNMPPELKHAFTGNVLLAGDLAINIVNTVSRELAKTVRAVHMLDDYQLKLKSAVKERPNDWRAVFYKPIRTEEGVTSKFRQLLDRTDEPGLTESDLALLDDAEVEALNGVLYGARKDENGLWQPTGDDLENVMWYDTRAYPEARSLPSGPLVNVLESFNTVLGRPKIYLAPRYYLNTFSNKAMAIIEQGPWWPVSMTAAHYAEEIYGEELTNRIRMHVGEGRAKSYAPGAAGVASRGMDNLAQWWHGVTDDRDRIGAFLWRAWQKGYVSKADMERLLVGPSNALENKAREQGYKAFMRKVKELGDKASEPGMLDTRLSGEGYRASQKATLRALNEGKSPAGNAAQARAAFESAGIKTEADIDRYWDTFGEEFKRARDEFMETGSASRPSPREHPDAAKIAQDLEEVSRRGNKDMVELNNLSWNEQHYWRHFIFVYPWRSRQALWTLRTIGNHPIKSLILEKIGQNAMDNSLQEEPQWLANAFKKYQDLGYMITGWDKSGDPIAVPAGQLNTFSGLNDILNFDVGNSVGPAIQFFVEGVTGKNRYGMDFKTRDGATGTEKTAEKWLQAFADVVLDMPQVMAWERGHRKENALPEPELANKQSILNRVKAAKDLTALSPGWLNGFGMLISGAGTERAVSRMKLLNQYYTSLDFKGRADFELALIKSQMNHQSKLLGRSIPEGATRAVEVQSYKSYLMNQWAKDHGAKDGVPDAVQDELLVQALKDKGLIDDGDVERLTKEIKGVGYGLAGEEAKQAHSDFRTRVLTRWGGLKQLSEWDSNIKQFATYQKGSFHRVIDRLRADGIGTKPAVIGNQEELFTLARKVLDFQDEVKARANARDLIHDSNKLREQQVIDRYWMDSVGDKPVVINGHTYPSLARLSYADANENERRNHLVGIAQRGWSSLSNLDKAILMGEKGENVVNGWARFNYIKAKYAEAGRSFTAKDAEYQVPLIAKQFPGWKQDYLFASEPLATRMKSYKPIQSSPYKGEWDRLLGAVQGLYSKFRAAGYSPGEAQTEYRKEYAKKLPQWIADNFSQGFQSELKTYTANHPKFIDNLMSR